MYNIVETLGLPIPPSPKPQYGANAPGHLLFVHLYIDT